MGFVVEPAPVASLPVACQEDRFPVRRIFCVGRNYADHAREMGHDPDREPPFFFTKPGYAVVADGADVPYPRETADLHHEIELVVAIGKPAESIDESEALDVVYGYAVGVDLTRRDLQAAAKKAGRPWDAAKGFDAGAPCGPINSVDRIGHPASGRIHLSVNGETRQDGDLNQMIWSVPESIAYLSRLFTLAPGDLIYTGTPAGVGAIERGDRIAGNVEGVGSVTFTLV